MKRLTVLVALALAYGVVACAALKGAEKDAATVFNDTRTASSKFCADEPKLKAAGLLVGKVAADADKFCQGVAFANASSVGIAVTTPAGSASVSVPTAQ